MRYYVEVLNNYMLKQRRIQSKFTLRDFAKYLDIDSASLSSILNKKRPFPLKYVQPVTNKLNLSEVEKQKFMQSVIEFRNNNKQTVKRKEVKEIRIPEKECQELISEWDFAAVLSIYKRESIVVDKSLVASELNLNLNRVEYIESKLNNWGIINLYLRKVNDGKIRFVTTEDKISDALIKSHLDGLDMAKEKLEQVDILMRDFSSTTFAINSKKINRAKKLIRKFRKEMDQLLEDGSEDKVYYLGVQLFPLSKV